MSKEGKVKQVLKEIASIFWQTIVVKELNKDACAFDIDVVSLHKRPVIKGFCFKKSKPKRCVILDKETTHVKVGVFYQQADKNKEAGGLVFVKKASVGFVAKVLALKVRFNLLLLMKRLDFIDVVALKWGKVLNLPLKRRNRILFFMRGGNSEKIRPILGEGESLVGLYYPVFPDGIKRKWISKESGSLYIVPDRRKWGRSKSKILLFIMKWYPRKKGRFIYF